MSVTLTGCSSPTGTTGKLSCGMTTVKFSRASVFISQGHLDTPASNHTPDAGLAHHKVRAMMLKVGDGASDS